ncbi:MAG: histidine kinase [bacterium]|nr:histidine kinase [bacterium]
MGLVFRWALVLSICAAQTAPLCAQQREYRFEHLSVQHGLSHGGIYSILQDSRGYMWFGTEDGLNRYDGISVTVFHHDPSDANTLSTSNFGEIYEDLSGLMWFGTWGGGLDRYDPRTRTFTHYRHDPADPHSLSQDRIEVLSGDAAGMLWIGTEGAGLNRLDPSTRRFDRFRHDPGDPGSLPSDEIRAIALDHHGDIWVGSNGGLSRFDRESGKFTHFFHDPGNPPSLGSNRVRAILAGSDGSIWVGTRGGGLNRLDPQTGTFRRYRHDPKAPGTLSTDAISCLWQDSTGILWVGTYNGGLNRLDPETGLADTYIYDENDPDGLSIDRIETIHGDRTGILWIGTRGGGVNKLDLKPAKFGNYSFRTSGSPSLPHPSVRAIAAEKAGPDGGGSPDLWIGTDGGGLARLDRGRGTFEYYRHQPADETSMSDNRVWSLLVDRSGDLWAGTYTGGLNKLVRTSDGVRFRRFRHDPARASSLSNDRVQTIFEDSEGVLWLGTADGLNRVTDGREELSFEVFRPEPAKVESLSNGYVVSLTQDNSGTLWVGTRRGLNHSIGDRSGFRPIEIPHESALASDLIQVILEDSRRPETLWVGTESSGLHRVDLTTRAARQYLVKDGLPGNVIDGLLEDDEGFLWLSTSRGLSRFDPESEVFRNYDTTDGLQSHSFIRSSCYRMEDGTMFFGGVSGLTSFLPTDVIDNPHPPPVVLTSFSVFAREIDLAESIENVGSIQLGHRDNFISIGFAALDYTAPEKNRYAYRLSGVDDQWIRSENRSFVSYAHLDPGRYVFRVKGSNNDGLWNETGNSLEIVISPPYWQSWWFRLVTVTVLAAAVFGAYRTRTRAIRFRNRLLEQRITERQLAEVARESLIEELEERNSEMERFTYTVSHDLKSPLVTIKGFLGFLERDSLAGDTERVRRDIGRINSAADKMGELLDELLELSRVGRKMNPPTEVELTELAHEARELIVGRLAERGVEVMIAKDLPTVIGDRARLLEVLQNLLDNAAKFTGEESTPRIEVGRREIDGQTAVFVRDNGEGIAEPYLEKVFELFERLDAHTEGTGIGLALVKRIVEVHGGRVWVESEGPGLGSTFYFVLPATGPPAW